MQRSKVHWMKVGNGDNKSFHRAVVAREAKNTIKEIQCRDGVVVSSAEEIMARVESSFRDFLQFVPSDFEGMTIADLEDIIPSRCTKIELH